MVQTIEAIYEDGVLKPLQPLNLPEHQRVSLTIQPVKSLTPDEILHLAHQVYAGLSDQEIDELESIILDRSNFMRQED